MHLSPASCNFICLWSRYSTLHPVFKHCQFVLPLTWDQVSLSYKEKSEIIFCIYCNLLGLFYSRWNFITLKVRYTTVKHSRQLF
jgi:hypothetical protein